MIPSWRSVPKRALTRLVERARGVHSVGDYRRAGASFGSGCLLNGLEVNLADAPFVTVGDYVVFGPGVLILTHDASTRDLIGFTRMETVWVGSHTFIGARSTILPGAHVGRDCIIGAGSLVRGTIPEGEVWAGVPARRLSTTEDFKARWDAASEPEPHYGDGWKSHMRDSRRRLQIIESLKDGRGWFY